MRRLASLAVGGVVLLGLAGLDAAVSRGAGFPEIAFVQSPRGVDAALPGGIAESILAPRYPRGMRVMVAKLGEPLADVRALSPQLYASTDPSFAPDGKSLLFVAKRSASDPLQIWEWATSEEHPRLLVPCASDCVNPVWLPNGRVAFASLRAEELEESGAGRSFSLFEWDPIEKRITRLSFNPSSEFEPVVLPDGRILFSSWQHTGSHYWPDGLGALLLVNADGTGIFPYAGNHSGAQWKRAARPRGEDEILYVAAESLREFGAGQLMSCRSSDAFAPPARVLEEPLLIADLSREGDRGLILAARDPARDGSSFDLFLLRDGERSAVFESDEYDETRPAMATVRGADELRFSTVVPESSHGFLLVLDCHESDRVDGDVLSPGSVAYVRVIQSEPGSSSLNSVDFARGEDFAHQTTGYGRSRILGEVKPAPDGSLYVRVPADRALRMQLLDVDGFPLLNERAWFWVRPNERRVCIGCHEDRELAPKNVAAMAAGRAPTDLTDPAEWREVGFARDIRPILDTSCARSQCHVPPRPTAGLNLSREWLEGEAPDAEDERAGDPAYLSLLRAQEGKPLSIGGRLVHPGDSRRSPLVWMLYGRALAPQYAPAPFERPMMEAHPGPMLPREQLDLIRRWIDLGAVLEASSNSAELGMGAPASRGDE